ncbi:hypothetical protein L3Q82_017841 [Scortum barcoo]|uniref:Uncharacterized protein n=1 Tax=Scortum barcoo TaxID=214431 RepID=A0ACB8VJE3_9TELE|nr:hypothetical protein L3Q82_017841 [Scortum barcoo]
MALPQGERAQRAPKSTAPGSGRSPGRAPKLQRPEELRRKDDHGGNAWPRGLPARGEVPRGILPHPCGRPFLFNFPLRYLLTIGLVPVFSLRWSLPPALARPSSLPDPPPKGNPSIPAGANGPPSELAHWRITRSALET